MDYIDICYGPYGTETFEGYGHFTSAKEVSDFACGRYVDTVILYKRDEWDAWEIESHTYFDVFDYTDKFKDVHAYYNRMAEDFYLDEIGIWVGNDRFAEIESELLKVMEVIENLGDNEILLFDSSKKTWSIHSHTDVEFSYKGESWMYAVIPREQYYKTYVQ